MKSSQEVLIELLNHLKISANKFAFEIGLNANTAIYHVKNGRNNISPELAKKIQKRYPELNYNWLLTGEGSMLKSESKTPAKQEAEEPGSHYENGKLEQFRQETQANFNALAEGMTRNFKVIADSLQTSMQRQEKLIDFVEQLDADKISKATGDLEKFIKKNE